MDNKKFSFTTDNLKKIEKIFKKYPKEKKQSAILPILDIAQKQNGGCLSFDIIDVVSEIIDISPIKTYSIAKFYDMFYFDKLGKYHLKICTGAPCMLKGAYEILEIVKSETKLSKEKTISEDELFSFQETECLGACTNAPIVAANDNFIGNLSQKDIKNIIQYVKNKKDKKIEEFYL